MSPGSLAQMPGWPQCWEGVRGVCVPLKGWAQAGKWGILSWHLCASHSQGGGRRGRDAAQAVFSVGVASVAGRAGWRF